VAQFEVAAGNLLAALAAAGGQPDHLVSIQIFVTDAPAWRAAQPDLGAAWRRHFGRHYPAVGLFQVAALFDPAAQVELVAIAVIPD
jgi:enamine deaminase RidA (YjgF/YER057c/UK114 family)